MAGRLFISKELKKREKVETAYGMKLVYGMLSNDSVLPIHLYYNKKNQGKKQSISKIHARCIFSGRAKANLNKFKMSRMIFKKFGEQGLLNGLKKASW
jgi:small subunit ribosomal protein S14